MRIVWLFIAFFVLGFNSKNPAAKDFWLGHWENASGYWIKIEGDATGKYAVYRSGNERGKVQLFFMDLNENCNKFIYKERYEAGFGYIHQLEAIDESSVRDKWISMEDGTVRKEDVLYRKP